MRPALAPLSHFLTTSWNFPFLVVREIGKAVRVAHIIAVETFATLTHILPAALKWWIKDNFYREFSRYSLELQVGNVKTSAKLYLHQKLNIEENHLYHPFLFVPGDHSHPYTLLHFAQIVKNSSNDPIFSLHIPCMHRDEDFPLHAALIDQALNKIESLIVERKGIFNGVVAVGHSKGAMLLVERQFASDQPSKISRTFCVAGPIKETQHAQIFQEPLKSIFDKVCQNIRQHQERKFIQIIPQNDWIAPYETMAVRPNEYCYTVPGMHLSGLYAKKTSKLFTKFLSQTA